MKYNFFVQERTICVNEKILNEDKNKSIKYRLKNIGSGITIIIHIDCDRMMTEEKRLNIIKDKLKSFINSDDITIDELHIKDINIL